MEPSERPTLTATARGRALVTAVFAAAVALVVLLLWHVAATPPHRPAMPDDAVHRSGDWNTCLQCHGDGKPQALPASHPIKKDDCLRCHESAATDR